MEIFMELLNKITATRNAQLVHMRNPTMMNNFTKIVYEVSFDEYLRDLTKMLAISGHKVTFPEDWVKPKLDDLKSRYSSQSEYDELKSNKIESNSYDAVVGKAATTSKKQTAPPTPPASLSGFQVCSKCTEKEMCKFDGCLRQDQIE